MNERRRMKPNSADYLCRNQILYPVPLQSIPPTCYKISIESSVCGWLGDFLQLSERVQHLDLRINKI